MKNPACITGKKPAAPKEKAGKQPWRACHGCIGNKKKAAAPLRQTGSIGINK